MKVFTKKNAFVGFLAVKAAKRALGRRRRRRSGARTVLLVSLGVLSVGLLAGIVLLARRQRGEEQAEEPGAGEESQPGAPLDAMAEPAPAA
ncbi:MAG TPA: hypothetical protein VNJ53_02915 [Gaiellaceae bacterium]|nr:hypothetical protein [Gaiellaceae bacterium]